MRQRTVSTEEARRIAVRAQALDGSASGVLETVRRLGFLQIDVVQPVERPQHLVLYSRLGPAYDRAELDRLLWEEKALFEWDAFIYPIEDLPLEEDVWISMVSRDGRLVPVRGTTVLRADDEVLALA